MDILVHVLCDFPAVFTVNGAFYDRLDRLTVDDGEAVYLSALPLSSTLLPYTVKLVGGAANDSAVRTVRLTASELLLFLFPRYGYVYSPRPERNFYTRSEGTVQRFFAAATAGDNVKARSCLTEGLSAAVSDKALAAFFDGYNDIIPLSLIADAPPSSFLLIDRSDRATPFSFKIKNSLIDDIAELPLP